MEIGLYSELARQHIVKIKEELSQKSIGSSDIKMRSFRNIIKKQIKRMISNLLNFLTFIV